MSRVAALAFSLSLSVFGQAQRIECVTPLGVPCVTIRARWSQWQTFSEGITDVRHFTWTTLSAFRQDGSQVRITEGRQFYRLLRGTTVGMDQASLYEAQTDRVISINHARRTISNREPIIWHDRPYRRSVAGDPECASGIKHFGTDFTRAGKGVIAGVPVVEWVRNYRSLREEVYLAPSLDCLPLKRHMGLYKAWMIPQFTSSMEAVSVTFGEPPAALFAVPSDYEQVKDPHRQRLLEFVRRNGRSLPFRYLSVEERVQ